MGVPALDSSAMPVLTQLVRLTRPVRVLEIGTGAGFSTWALLEGCCPARIEKLTSIEWNRDRHDFAAQLLARHPLADRLDLVCSNALDFLPMIDETCDFVFIDAIKRHYPIYLELISGLKWTTAVFDNIIGRGSHAKPPAEIIPQRRAATGDMERFLRHVAEDAGMHACVIPVGDGLLTLSRTY
nr:class I SAM-dependent methyltransferase [Desulfurispira natronophila]